MTSSQALTINVLGPLLSDAAWAAGIFGNVLTRPIVDVTRAFIEFAPNERVRTMGDRTIADAYFEFEDECGRAGLVVETKLADGFGARDLQVSRNLKYLSLNDRFALWDVESQSFGAGKFDQLARIHALGSVAADAPATLLVLHHPADSRTPEIAAQYGDSLIDPALLKVMDLDKFFVTMSKSAANDSHRDMVAKLSLRYTGHDQSEEVWEAISSRSRRGHS